MVSQLQFYDTTIGGQLMELPGVQRATVCYHAYPWEPAEERYLSALARAADCCRVLMLDYEPWAIDTENAAIVPHIGPIDPHAAPIADVQTRHEQYARAIAAILPRAQEAGVQVGVYDFLALYHRRGEDIYSRHRLWQLEQQLVLRLPVMIDEEETTLLSLLNETGGGVWIGCYLPNGWNVTERENFHTKAVTVFERLCGEVEAAGGRAIPLLHPYTIGTGQNPTIVDPVIMRKLISWARQRAWGVWANQNQITDEFRALIRQEVLG